MSLLRRVSSCSWKPAAYSFSLSVWVALGAVMLRFVYTYTCSDYPASPLPYKDDSIVFGVLAYFTLRVASMAQLSKKRVLIHSFVDQLIFGTILFYAAGLIWRYIPTMTVWQFSLIALFAASVQMVISGFFFIRNDWLSKCLPYTIFTGMPYISIALITAISFCVFYVFGNMANSPSGKTSMANLILGVIFPVFKTMFLRVQGHQKVWSKREPLNQAQEADNNGKLVVFIIAQEAVWGFVGKFLIMRASVTAFIASSFLSTGVSFCERMLTVGYFWYQKRQGVKVGIAVENTSQKSENVVIQPIIDPLGNVMASKEDEESSEAKRSPLMLSPLTNRRMTEIMFSFTSLDQTEIDKIKKHKNVDSNANDADFVLEDMSSVTSTVKIEEEGEVETSAVSTENIPFRPMSPEANYALLQLSKLTANWMSRISAVLVSWVLMTGEPVTTWGSCYTHPGLFDNPSLEILFRLVVIVLVSLMADVLSVFLEIRIGGYDYETATKNFSFNYHGYWFIACTVISAIALIPLSETGILDSVMTSCFQAGRRVYG